MSVTVEERDEGKLQVNTEARNMAAYTLHITANPKNFDPAHSDLIVMKGERTRERVDASYQAWRNHASKGNSWKLLQRMDTYYNNLWRVDDNGNHSQKNVPG